VATQYDNWLEGDCGIDEREEFRSDFIERRAGELMGDPEWVEVTAVSELPFAMESDQLDYAIALVAQLHAVEPADLVGSGLLTDLYRMSREMNAILREVAREQAEDEFDAATGAA
jgi:hypothetical protein